MDSREALIALNMIQDVGPVRVRHLLDHFGAAENILAAGQTQLERVPGIGPALAAAIAGWEKQVDLAGELKRIESFGCNIVIQTDENYPKLLLQIYDPPTVLYVKGALLPRDQNGVAIVGSRLTTPYGLDVARKLSYQLAYIGVPVVSGGARGIDTAAHVGALSAKGRTIAVLGTGINLIYPAENAELFERIAGSGAVITQFPFNRNGDKQSFPIRNRLVAGMTLGTVVVEANMTSGALITARMANDNGRQVFAVPGRVDSPRSKGCHDLIKNGGAKLCESAEDILGEFEYLFPRSQSASLIKEEGQMPAFSLSHNETTLYDLIDKDGRSIDDLIRRSGLAPSAVSVTLLGLEMKRLVRQLPGKIFVKNL